MYRLRGLSYILILMALLAGVFKGVGGDSLKAIFTFSESSVGSKKLEFFWQETGLSQENLFELVNNEFCQKSERYFLSCVNSLRQNLLNKNLQISVHTGKLVRASSQQLNQTEKLALASFEVMYSKQMESKIDFEAIWQQVINSESNQAKKTTLIANGINGFLSVFKDPHTYIMPAQYQKFANSAAERSKLFVGLSFEMKPGNEIFIRKVFKSSDAEKAGLKRGDRLLGFNEMKMEELSLEKISQLLRSEDQSQFSFKVKRDDQKLNIQLKRSFKPIKYVQSEVIDGFKPYAILTLTKFTEGVCSEVKLQLQQVLKQKPHGVVLDLRDNPGGYLEEASCIAGLFLGKDLPIYSVQYTNSIRPDEVSVSSSKSIYAGPLTVLINGSSASAAELLSGALQEYGRATLVGERSFGKGTFQEGEVWAKNPQINLYKTMGYYLLPSGKTTQLKGIEPDIYFQENDSQKREEDLYYRPFVAADISTENKFSKNKISLKFMESCIFDNTLVNEDKLLEKGLQTLACQGSGATLALDSNLE